MHAWLHQIDQHFPVRYLAWLLSAIGLLLFTFTWVAFQIGGPIALLRRAGGHGWAVTEAGLYRRDATGWVRVGTERVDVPTVGAVAIRSNAR